MKFKITLVALLSTFLSLNAQEISDTKFGKGLINFTAKDSSFSVKFAPRMQVRSISSWDHDGDQY
ncbi:MAG: porin, partial [Flavobacteriaceae bacterium]|nr:porin [Flavobacteriaceae bacterium]